MENMSHEIMEHYAMAPAPGPEPMGMIATAGRRRLSDGAPLSLRRLAELAQSELKYCPSVHELLSESESFSTFLNIVDASDLQGAARPLGGFRV